MTDRGFGVAGLFVGGNVRRLMYQSLIWPFVPGDDTRRLRSPLDAKRGERLANALIDGVRRDVQFGRDFLGAEVLIDEEKAVELALGKSGDALGH
jgi:hypothetical protein